MIQIMPIMRESSVESAAPATPQPKPKIKTAFPTIFITFVLTEISIGKRLLPQAL